MYPAALKTDRGGCTALLNYPILNFMASNSTVIGLYMIFVSISPNAKFSLNNSHCLTMLNPHTSHIMSKYAKELNNPGACKAVKV